MAVYEVPRSEWTKDGRKWIYKVDYKDLAGNKKQKKSKKFLTKSEAKIAEAEFRKSLKMGNVNLEYDLSKITFKELRLKHTEFNTTKVKNSTLGNYEDRDRYVVFFDNLKLSDLSKHHFDSWVKKMDTEYPNLSIGYKNDIIKYLKSIINYGRNELDLNLTKFYNKIKKFTNAEEVKKEMDFYTFEEFIKFISTAPNLLSKCLYSTLYYCGLRRGEARGLTWKHVDFKNGQIYIKQQVVNPKRYTSKEGFKWKITSLKTKSSERVIPLPKVLLNDLIELKRYCQQNQFGFNDDYFVFGDAIPITLYAIRQGAINIAETSDIRHIRLHDFRHSCASLLINNGANVTLVSRYLGHSSVEETLDTYSHLFKSKLDDIVNLIDKLDDNCAKYLYNINFYSTELSREISLIDYLKEMFYKILTNNKVLENDLVGSLLEKNIIKNEYEYIGIINNFIEAF